MAALTLTEGQIFTQHYLGTSAAPVMYRVELAYNKGYLCKVSHDNGTTWSREYVNKSENLLLRSITDKSIVLN